jgi:hypothetical protein
MPDDSEHRAAARLNSDEVTKMLRGSLSQTQDLRVLLTFLRNS